MGPPPQQTSSHTHRFQNPNVESDFRRGRRGRSGRIAARKATLARCDTVAPRLLAIVARAASGRGEGKELHMKHEQKASASGRTATAEFHTDTDNPVIYAEVGKQRSGVFFS